MQRLLKRDQTPPDFFRFTHPETGWESKAIDIHTWFQEITAHRKANNLPPITLEDAESQLCEILPPGHCVHHKPNKFVNTRLSWGDIVQGAKAYVALIASGFQTVSQEEADRRARICSGCYLRVQPQGCGSCVKLSRIIVGDIARKKTAHDSHLLNRACSACKCPLQPLVHFPLAILERADTTALQESLPAFCWRKQMGTNYQPNAI